MRSLRERRVQLINTTNKHGSLRQYKGVYSNNKTKKRPNNHNKEIGGRKVSVKKIVHGVNTRILFTAKA